jgi:hypothetical protein
MNHRFSFDPEGITRFVNNVEHVAREMGRAIVAIKAFAVEVSPLLERFKAK